MRKKIGIFLVSMMLVILTFSSFRIINIETSVALFEGGEPITLWHFDEGTGTTAYDSSGNNYHITIYGANWSEGVSGSCLEYYHNYALVEDFESYVYTCNIWLKPEETITKYSGDSGSQNTIRLLDFFNYDLGLGDCTSLVDDETIAVVQQAPTEPRTAVLDQDITNSLWHMISITWNHSLSRYDIYFDGIKKPVVFGGGGHSGLIYCKYLIIGSDIYSFIGKVDEISIYDYALDENEILALYTEYAPDKPVADFTYSPVEPESIDVIGFTDTSTDEDGIVVSWWWNFGDGYYSDLQNPVHCYYVDGTYDVILTVTDDTSLQDTITKTIIVESEYVIPATIDIEPDAFDLNKGGKWVNCFIELPISYNVEDINVNTVMMNDAVYAETSPTAIGDHDSDTIPDLKVRFDKQNLQGVLSPGVNVEIIITGELYDTTQFEGTDYVIVT